MLLNIDNDYRITADQHNYILQKRHEVKDKDTKEIKEEVWKSKTFHNKISGALQAYLDVKIKESKKRTWPTFIKEVRELEKTMAEMLKVVDIKPLKRTGR